MNDDHTIRCPACLAEYSRNDAPAEYLRVLHILDPRHDQQSRLARLSADILAKDKLPQMSKEEQDELVANLGLDKCFSSKQDLLPHEQESIRGYLKSIFPGAKAFSEPTTILEQVCLGLQKLGVDCAVETTVIICPLVDGNDLRFGRFAEHEDATWEGLFVKPEVTNSWVSDVPATCTDAQRITKAIYAWIKRFDYREYRGPAK